MYRKPLRICWILTSLLLGGCWGRADNEVVVYTALDSEFSRPIFTRFTSETGTRVLPKFDVESTKTVGLVEELIAERQRPRCDVFWNNEILHTLRLEELGLLDAYHAQNAADFPPEFRSARGAWHGLAARARVLLVNTKLVDPAERPKSIRDLVDPRYRRRVGVAKPLFGTTATHAACLFAAWGDERAQEFFGQLAGNAQVLSGNKQVALAVSAGQIAFGLTDTDDAVIEIERGMPVAIVYPDQEAGGLGTLFIPNTVCILKGCPNPAAARRLVDYLLSPTVEEQLASGESAQIPLGARANVRPRVETPRTVRAMAVDFDKALEKWPVAAEFLREEFTGAK